MVTANFNFSSNSYDDLKNIFNSATIKFDNPIKFSQKIYLNEAPKVSLR